MHYVHTCTLHFQSVQYIFKGYNNYHYKCCHGHLPSRKNVYSLANQGEQMCKVSHMTSIHPTLSHPDNYYHA